MIKQHAVSVTIIGILILIPILLMAIGNAPLQFFGMIAWLVVVAGMLTALGIKGLAKFFHG
ncbi:hypothetical protein [Lacticaseibacillus zhaodongensis]|uniref:hypothetical protein n=1 Tax=Lacticaseibacillus zhaodongensis TaxID=2668065 RepID=UPI0012D2BDF4|nr:hypothetical protein [Lacticaseibacillus zhaodongensis]